MLDPMSRRAPDRGDNPAGVAILLHLLGFEYERIRRGRTAHRMPGGERARVGVAGDLHLSERLNDKGRPRVIARQRVDEEFPAQARAPRHHVILEGCREKLQIDPPGILREAERHVRNFKRASVVDGHGVRNIRYRQLLSCQFEGDLWTRRGVRRSRDRGRRGEGGFRA